jgi:hypothetical protein
MNLPGLGLHSLKGPLKSFWSVSVSGNWRVIFRFEKGIFISSHIQSIDPFGTSLGNDRVSSGLTFLASFNPSIPF